MERSAAELIQEFLYCTRDLPRQEAAEIAGIHETILDRWEILPRKQLRRTTRERMEGFLRAGPSVRKRDR